MKYLYSFIAMGMKEWIEWKRYWFNSIVGLVIYLIVFVSLFTGAQYIGQNNFALGESLEGFLIGYALWFMAMGAMSETANSIVDEARKGTLEQLYMTEIPFTWLLISKNIISTLIYTAIFFLIVNLQILFTGLTLNIDIISIFVTLFIGLFSLYGIGLVLAGIGLVYKKVQNVLGATQFILIGVMILSPLEIPIVKILPFAYARQLIMDIMKDGKGLLSFSATDYFYLVGVSVLYIIIGIAAYKVAEGQGLKKGMLGQY